MGLAHLDIKPDNILLNSNDEEDARSSLITLIDFSASERYQDRKGRHLPKNKVSNF